MSAQLDTVTTLETIEHLDFKAKMPCEHSHHQPLPPHDADLLIRSTCGMCNGPTVVLGICFEVWARFVSIRCNCGHRDERGFFWTVLEVLS